MATCAQTQASYTSALHACGFTPTVWCADAACLSNSQRWCNLSQCTAAWALAKHMSTQCGSHSPPIPLQICDGACVGAMRVVHDLVTACTAVTTANHTGLADCRACQHYQGNRSKLATHCAFDIMTSNPAVATAIALCKSTFPQLASSFPSSLDTIAVVVHDEPSLSQNPQVFVTVIVLGMVVAVSVGILVYFQFRKLRHAHGRDLFRDVIIIQPPNRVHHVYRRRSWRQSAGPTRKPQRRSILTFEDEAPYILPSPTSYDMVLGSPRSTGIEDVRFDKKLTQFRIPVDEFVNKSPLQTGGQASLFRAQWRGRDVAIKQIAPMHAKDFYALQEFMREIRLSAYCRHPSIVEFLGISWRTLKDMSIVTEYMVHGDLYSVLRHQRELRPQDQWLRWYDHSTDDSDGGVDGRRRHTVHRIHLGFNCRRVNPSKLAMALQVAQALQYLHSMRIVHRDIKSKNVVLNTLYTAKLCDFGISRRLSDLMTANRGTLAYMAPEVFQGNKYTEMADMYSFGVLLSEMDKLDSPYVGDMPDVDPAVTFPDAKIAMMVAEGSLKPSFTKSMPREILHVALKCLAFDATLRPTADELVDALALLMHQHRAQATCAARPLWNEPIPPRAHRHAAANDGT
ncbi:TKL protein kinase [Aphanomyces invadans]|uniref:TKL protein kinase n=1 Tax=Aphanomyces invadans TaxID=157072 RepID=A0A024TJ76_9STRA|nr:TKL protein kinase [Aphanomyces invadans]ETV93372.1 TKL protein kinase [Aphanomyces invadans]|eukprot:XP_008878008.1 TKL protein kinase [Aphanomyces invadans]